MNTSPWIAITGKDAGPHYPSYLNPALITEVCFWTDPAQQRVATVHRLGGDKVDLRESAAIQALGTLTRGAPHLPPDPEPAPIAACSRR